MTNFRRLLALILGASALSIAACDGGTSMQTSFIPAPPPPPPPPTPPAQGPADVAILPQPVTGDFAVAGAWTNLGADGATFDGHIDSNPADQPQIRYTADGTYEIKLPGEDYGSLVHDPSAVNPAASDGSLVVDACCGSRPVTILSPNGGFTYSAIAKWNRPDLDFAATTDSGVFAFGQATPAGDVPVTGSASYEGIAIGSTSVKVGGYFPGAIDWWPAYVMSAYGSVQLNFDFGHGTLGGHLDLNVDAGPPVMSVGTFDFTQTVFSPGSNSYSGTFATSLPGTNSFSGLFTGPHAEETIGSWAVPFQLEGTTYQAWGAWAAKAR